MATIGIVYFSMYGHTHEFAQELAAAVEKAGGTAELRRAPHDLPQEVAESDGVKQAIEAQSDVPEADIQEFDDFDGIIFGTPTRFGSATSQLQKVFDQCGPLWQEGRLVGTPAGFFTGSATIHGGQESTILSLSTFAYHQGMPIIPMGYSDPAVGETRTGGGPYGPTHFSPQGDETKDGFSEHELEIARTYASRFHDIAEKLAA